MKRLNLFLAISVWCIVSCSPPEQWVREYDEEGRLVEEYTLDPRDSSIHGLFHRYYESGAKFETAEYAHGILHGQRTIFYKSGETEIIEHYNNGTFVGPFESFYSNGQLEIVGLYQDGVMTGIWKRYYNSGELMEEVAMAENNENGPFTEYYKNGNLKAQGSYKDGDNEHGSLKLYNEQGELTRKMECNLGVCHTIWKSENDEENLQ